MEIAEVRDVQHMLQTALDELTKSIAEQYSSITPATSAALQSYLPNRAAVLFSMLSITMSSLTFSLNFTPFRRQWQRLFRHSQNFFCGTSERFNHIKESNPADYEKTDTFLLYLTSGEFRALVALARETTFQVDAQTSIYTSPCLPSLRPRAYPSIASPQYAQYSTWNYFCVSCMHSTFIILSHVSSLNFSSSTLLLNFVWCLLFVRV